MGVDRGELESLIKRNARSAPETNVDIRDGVVDIGAGSAAAATGEVWLVRYDPNIVEVAIQRGENEGRTLPHKNVVRELVKLGDWSGQPESFRLPGPGRAGLREAVLVQDGPGGVILAAARN